MDDARPSRTVRWLAALAMSVPVLWSLVAHAMGPTARPMAAEPPRPPLAFAQHLVDLGPVSPSEEVFAHFDFVNRGENTVTITHLEPSCGCLQPELRKRKYRPGEAGHFLLRVQTANQNAGDKEYHVRVKYNDPWPHEADLTFRVTLPENQVFIRPRALIVSNLGSSEPTTWDVEIIDRRPEPLSIVRAECTRSQLASVEPGPSDVDSEGHTHHRLRLTIPGNLPEGRIEAVVRVYTNDPAYRTLRVPLIIQGKNRPNFAKRKTTIVDPLIKPASAHEEAATGE